MRFKILIPYSQLDIDIAESINIPLEGFYANLEELREYEGDDVDWTIIEVDDITLDYGEDCFISFENIGLN